MKAAYYRSQGKAEEVLELGEIEEVLPKEGEVQLSIHFSGVNPGEVKKRSDAFGVGMPYDLIIPHSDGAGIISKVGEGLDPSWIGKKVLCFGAQSYRQFGTAAEYCCVPVENVVEIGEGVSLEQAAQMGIPGITAHRAVHVGNGEIRMDRTDQVVLVQGGSGAVGQCAVALAKNAGATVIATVRKNEDIQTAVSAGADKVFLADRQLKDNVLNEYPKGVDHLIEVAFAANIETDVSILKQRGSIATYATDKNPASIPFWPLVFSNVSVFFLGSDDFSTESKSAAAEDLVTALKAGWKGLEIGAIYELDNIAKAHEHIESRKPGRALVRIKE